MLDQKYTDFDSQVGLIERRDKNWDLKQLLFVEVVRPKMCLLPQIQRLTHPGRNPEPKLSIDISCRFEKVVELRELIVEIIENIYQDMLKHFKE